MGSRINVCLLFVSVLLIGVSAHVTKGQGNCSKSEQTISPVYVFENYFDDPEKSISKWGTQRLTDSNGVKVNIVDVSDQSKVLGSLEYDSDGIRKNGLGAGLKNESVFWFWKTKPAIGDGANLIRRSRKFSRNRSEKPKIVDVEVKITYLRTEILEVLGKKMRTHVVEESWGENTRDLKWLDEIGMPVRIVHIVGKETRSSILTSRLSKC